MTDAVSWLEATRRRPTLRPYELGPLADALGCDVDDTGTLALVLGLNRGSVKRYRTLGLTSAQADVWAERAGLDAAVVWPGPEWVLWGAARVNALKRVCPEGHALDRVDSRGWRVCAPCPRAAFERYRQRKSLTRALIAPSAARRAPVVWLGDRMARRRPITAHVQPELAEELAARAAAAGVTVSALVCMTLTEAIRNQPESEQVAS